MASFPNVFAPVGAGHAAPVSHNTVEFKAGKLVRDGTTMRSDPRRGLLKVVKADDDLVHLQWKPRDSAAWEDDLLIFPEEARLVPLNPKRCYVLKFPGQKDRDMFFWMQEPKAEEDEALVARFNTIIHAASAAAAGVPAPAPPAASSAAVGATPAAAVAHTPSTAPPAPAKGAGSGLVATPGSSGPVSQAQLQSILSNLGLPPAPAATPAGGRADASALAAALAAAMQQMAGGGAGAVAEGPSLRELLTPEVVLPVVHSPDVLARLAQYLPEEQRDPATVNDLVTSPQFLSQLDTLTRALASGRMDIGQFGLHGAGAGAFSVADFLAAIDAQTAAERQQQEQQQQGGGAAAPPGEQSPPAPQ